jgi:hypothetical protein
VAVVDIFNEALSQFAVTVNAFPNALFEGVDPLRAFLDQETRHQTQVARNAHVIA